MIVLGVDPGIANLGLSVHEVGGGVPPTLCYLKAHHTEAGEKLENRIVELVRVTVSVATKYHVQIAGIEDQDEVSWAKDQAGHFDKNSRRGRDMQYAIAGALIAIGVAVHMIGPRTGRAVLLGKGNGNAPKQMLRQFCEHHMRKSLTAEIRWSEHGCDSMAAGAGAWAKHRQLEATPKMLGGKA